MAPQRGSTVQFSLRHGDFSVSYAAVANAGVSLAEESVAGVSLAGSGGAGSNFDAAVDAGRSSAEVNGATPPPAPMGEAPEGADAPADAPVSSGSPAPAPAQAPPPKTNEDDGAVGGEQTEEPTFRCPSDYPGTSKIYIVWRAPKKPELEGLWCCPWEWLEDCLPGKALCGSGVALRGHRDIGAALRHWALKHGDRPCKRRA